MATFEEWWQSTNLGIHSTSESIGKSSWNAGAASRDAEVAELRELSPCGKHSIIHWARPMRAEPFCTVCAEIAELRAQLERATDLVRYARHEPINWHIIDACQACSEHYGICEHHKKLYGDHFRSEPKPKSALGKACGANCASITTGLSRTGG